MHARNSPAHSGAFRCTLCNKNFRNEERLQHHKISSPRHAPKFNCRLCNKNFASEEALEDHKRDSPSHDPIFHCGRCNRNFGSINALERHECDSPVQSPNFHCNLCDRSFGGQEDLENHIRAAQTYQPSPTTPLDTFFRSFPGFGYNPELPPATSYANLREYKGWRRGDPESDKVWHRYQDALDGELQMWFGSEDDLVAWHALCRAIGIVPPPQTCRQCRKATRRTQVNIVDLIEWGRRRDNETSPSVRTFATQQELQDYTRETRKFYRNTPGQNNRTVLSHLLRKIF